MGLFYDLLLDDVKDKWDRDAIQAVLDNVHEMANVHHETAKGNVLTLSGLPGQGQSGEFLAFLATIPPVVNQNALASYDAIAEAEQVAANASEATAEAAVAADAELTGDAVVTSWIDVFTGPVGWIIGGLIAAGIGVAIIFAFRDQVEAIVKEVERLFPTTPPQRQPVPQKQQQDKPTTGGSQDPGPWVDPFPTPRDTKRKDDEPCKPEDFATFALKLSPVGSPSYGAKYVDNIITAHGPIEACYILRELTEIYSDPAMAVGNNAGLIGVQNYLLQGDASKWFIGAFFELQWIHDHMAVVTAIEPTRPDGYQGPDAMALSEWGPAVIDFKSWEYDTFSSSWQKMLKQAQNYHRLYEGQAIVFVCDASKVPDPAEQQALADAFQRNVASKMPGVVVKITFWKPEDPTNPLDGTTIASEDQ